jgi:hypothetical protein
MPDLYPSLALGGEIGLHHPLDGVTNPEYKLLHFIQLLKDSTPMVSSQSIDQYGSE